MHSAWLTRVTGAIGFVALLVFADRIPDEENHRPSRKPDRVVLTWASDPATTQAVTWRTSAVVEKALAQLAVATDGPEFAKVAETYPAESTPFKSDLGDAKYHSIVFRKLKPETLYAYRVGDGSNWTEWSQFRTASDKPGPLTFVYFGDAQTDVFSMWSRVVRTGFTFAPQARFLLHAGDLVNRGYRDADWGEWHRAPGWLNSTIPLVPSPGNHEYGAVDGKRRLTAHWRTQFTLPENGVPGLEESCYYLDVHGVRIVSLNSNEKQKEQAAWLDELLEDNPNSWTIVAFHHPIFSASRGRDNAKLRGLWQPVFDEHGVDLVLTGHDHTYARSNVLSGTNVQAGKSGTVYVVSVSGPKMYKVDREPWMQRSAENTQLFQVITVDGAQLGFQARTPTGLLYDSFELRKRENQPNEMINIDTRTPERVGVQAGG
jgi:3',5'-cyclic AMP phosphodiesterase CpdA